MKKFDLTTSEGLSIAKSFLGKEILSHPLIVLGKMILDKLFSTPEEQGKVVRELIEKGKREGVDEMEIEMYDKGGLDIDAPIEGCKIQAHIGKNQKTRIHVKYK